MYLLDMATSPFKQPALDMLSCILVEGKVLTGKVHFQKKKKAKAVTLHICCHTEFVVKWNLLLQWNCCEIEQDLEMLEYWIIMLYDKCHWNGNPPLQYWLLTNVPCQILVQAVHMKIHFTVWPYIFLFNVRKSMVRLLAFDWLYKQVFSRLWGYKNCSMVGKL